MKIVGSMIAITLLLAQVACAPIARPERAATLGRATPAAPTTSDPPDAVIGSVAPVAPVAPVPSAVPGPDPRKMTFPPQSIDSLRPDRVLLPNGMVLFLMEDHELPLISVEVAIRTGSIYDPADRVGLAGMTGSVLRTGGTERQGGDEIDLWVDQVAAELSSGIGVDAGRVALDVLAKDFDAGLALLADVLMRPRFAEEKLEVARAAAIEGIRRRNDRPSGIASREFRKQLYGAAGPYGREATEATVNAIRRDDLLAFHQKYFVPNQTFMAITGDFNRVEMVKKIKSAFADWKKKEVTFPTVAAAVEPKAGVYFVPRPISQTQIRVGHLSIRQSDPDFFALSILDNILGGSGFSSRLFNDIRTQQGLAYAVGSVLRAGHFERGDFVLYGETRAETTHPTLSAMIGHLKKIRETPVSEAELELAKAAFLNSFIFSFESSAQITERRASLEYYNLPEDFLERFRNQVAEVTREDILRVAKLHLHPDRLVILAVGDATKIDPPLSTFGPVNEIVLTP
jgi:predicted Zn-dependent peptidase